MFKPLPPWTLLKYHQAEVLLRGDHNLREAWHHPRVLPQSLCLWQIHRRTQERGVSWKVAAQVRVRNCARGARRRAEKEGASRDAAAHTGLSWKVELETVSTFAGTCVDWVLISRPCIEKKIGLLRWLSGKDYVCQCRRHGFDPWVRKIP